jgi:hypothetical protein
MVVQLLYHGNDRSDRNQDERKRTNYFAKSLKGQMDQAGILCVQLDQVLKTLMMLLDQGLKLQMYVSDCNCKYE